MKARVKATGEIVEVFPYYKDGFAYIHEDGETVYETIELEIDEYEPDYWERLKHQYAGMAMQGMLSNEGIMCHSQSTEGWNDFISENAVSFATAFVERMKETNNQ